MCEIQNAEDKERNAELEALIEQAKCENSWIYSPLTHTSYHPETFEDDLLGEAIDIHDDWEVKPPAEILKDLDAACSRACENLHHFQLQFTESIERYGHV